MMHALYIFVAFWGGWEHYRLINVSFIMTIYACFALNALQGSQRDAKHHPVISDFRLSTVNINLNEFGRSSKHADTLIKV